ncbi:hypothetical protein XELAEV_18035558mg [Xenopus laevis]|uniref:Uncharacterized protein n=1 Tax=Xenopus laevis TaxID=8355 RepID=A0A974CFZ7_XENLA|nr:hypothetical protein XELAEV_18035558mg [Xenopus laevis]
MNYIMNHELISSIKVTCELLPFPMNEDLHEFRSILSHTFFWMFQHGKLFVVRKTSATIPSLAIPVSVLGMEK